MNEEAFLLPYRQCEKLCEAVRQELHYPDGILRKDADVNWQRCLELMTAANQLAERVGLPVRYDLERFRKTAARYRKTRMH